MFSGIIEERGKVVSVQKDGSNIHFTIECSFAKEVKVDQSIAHNGVCLTVVDKKKGTYTVTAIKETLLRTGLGGLKKGDTVNLERCVMLGDRLDGHIVQGHVDGTAVCTSVKKEKGSHLFVFRYDGNCTDAAYLVVEKGSVTVNGVSLTVVASDKEGFSVAIIPYTFGHTNFSELRKGSTVNIEFDVIGKYVLNYLKGS